MLRKKPRVPETKSGDPNFIKFSKVQRDYLREVFRRTQNEFNSALESVYTEVGIMEAVIKNPQGYILSQDFSGIMKAKPPEPKKPEPSNPNQPS